MASTIYQDYNQNTPIVSAWLNDINKGIYSALGLPRVAADIPVAWVRFSAVAGVVTISQSQNIASVVRTGAGTYVVTYGAALVNVQNSYQIQSNVPGFTSWSAETNQSVTIQVQNTAAAFIDTFSACVGISGAN